MGGLARILIESGHKVSGSDQNFYPPMSDQLNELGIQLEKGYEASKLPEADLYVIGNVLSRGNECVEEILNKKLPYKSGPEMLGEIVNDRFVIAVSGTHGKTTTSFMISKIFQSVGKDIGFLIGGISPNFEFSAKLGTDEVFVIEADEYDSAFFDKRSKFIHYHPDILLINNLEFDHADIFRDIEDIKKQFINLLNIMRDDAKVISFSIQPGIDSDPVNPDIVDIIGRYQYPNLKKVNIGLREFYFGWDDEYENHLAENENLIIFDPESLRLYIGRETGKEVTLNSLPFYGPHNMKNATAAIVAAVTYGINFTDAYHGLSDFEGVKRRLEERYSFNGITIIDDFAHHPTAIQFAIDSVQKKYKNKRILNVIELGSNTMSSGYHSMELLDIDSHYESFFREHGKIFWLDHSHGLEDDIYYRFQSHDELNKEIAENYKDFDVFLIMTNRDSTKIIEPLKELIEAS